jgi:hypothetical protein
MELVRRSLAEPPQPVWLWPTGSRWDWPDENWLEQLRASGVEAGLLPSVVKYVETERLRSLTAEMHRRRTQESPEWPIEAMLMLVEAITRERGRQLAAMTDAMSRFIGEVVPS